MKNQNEITDINNLIAKFMGETPYHNKTPETISNNGMIYHLSWDWLMPVVEKIEKLFDGYVLVEISDESCRISYHNMYEEYCVMSSKIEATWHACAKFIKWYNENKK